MLFSIITPSLNCGELIELNIESVLKQGMATNEIEHWIIDGGSEDGTLAILEKYAHLKWVSEPDSGLSHAVNKGLERCRGEWIMWLNADDHLAPNALQNIFRVIERDPDVHLISGDQEILDYEGRFERINKGWAYDRNELLGCRTGIAQASIVIHRDVFDSVGLLDEAMKYTMDYEWLLRATTKYRCAYIPEVFSRYRRRKGSITDVGLYQQFQDFLRLRRKYKRGYLELAELRIRFYLWTKPLRRIRWLRRCVRFVKRCLGIKQTGPLT